MGHTNRIPFPYEEENTFEVGISNQKIKHILDEHICHSKSFWISRFGISEVLLNNYIKSDNKKYKDHKGLYDCIASAISDLVRWSAALPQYIYLEEERSGRNIRGEKRQIRSFVMVAQCGSLIVVRKSNGETLRVVTSYYPVEVEEMVSDYTLFVRSVKSTTMKYGKKKILDSKYSTERVVVKSRYVTEAHWIVVPSYREYCGVRI